MKNILKLVGIVFILFSCESGNLTSYKSTFSQKMLLEDYDRLYDSILVNHPKTFTNLEELEEIKNIQREKIKRMSKLEYLKIVSLLLSKVNCGHTSLNLDFVEDRTIIEKGNFLPIQVRIINRKIFLIKDFSDNEITPGSEILSINNLTSEQIVDQLYSSLSSDGGIETSKERMLNMSMRFNYHYYLLVESSSNYAIEYSSPGDSSINEITVKSTNFDGLISNYNKTPYKYNYKDDISYQFNDNYALLTIPHFVYYDTAKLKKFRNDIDLFFLKLKESNISDLILDLRGNGGGDPIAGNLLLTYLLEKPFQYFADNTPFYDDLIKDSEIHNNSFRGKLYTLIDGGCFSTTGHVLSLLKDQNRGLFIGQESGAGFICNDSSIEVSLINSGLKFNLAKKTYATSVKGQELGRGIVPDVLINYSIYDYIDKIDLEMIYVTNKIAESL